MDFFAKTKSFIGSLLFLGAAPNTYACSVCFTQVEDDPQSIALKWSVLTLFAIVLVVLGMVAKFFFDIVRREKTLMKEN